MQSDPQSVLTHSSRRKTAGHMMIRKSILASLIYLSSYVCVSNTLDTCNCIPSWGLLFLSAISGILDTI